MLYRYELSFFGARQNIGIFHGMNDNLDLDEETESALMYEVDNFLPFPNVADGCRFKSYFTEEGNARFYDAIQNLISVYENDSIFDVDCVTISESSLKQEDIVYSDYYQVCVKDGGH